LLSSVERPQDYNGKNHNSLISSPFTYQAPESGALDNKGDRFHKMKTFF